MEYTNSSLVEYTRLSPYNSGQRKHAIDRITPHCVVGQVTAQSLGEWFSENNRGASSNYGIGLNGEVGMYCPESVRSWCSSNANNDNRAITIECASDTAPPYAFRDVVYQKLIKLCADICQRNGKTKLLWIADKTKRLTYNPALNEMVLTMHKDFFDTDCPGAWMESRMGDLAEKVTILLTGNDAQEPTVQPIPEPKSNPVGLQARNLALLSNVDIIKTVGPLFTADQQKTGILASVSMAQFILESGYCHTELAINANNCFGMKCMISGNTWPETTWDGESKYRMSTDEYNTDGSKFTIVEDFRAYPCIENSIADHSAYLLGAMKDNEKRYAGLAGCASAKKAAQIIKDGGYATAPDYIDALMYIIELWDLEQWDAPTTAKPDNPTTVKNYIMVSEEDWKILKDIVNKYAFSME